MISREEAISLIKKRFSKGFRIKEVFEFKGKYLFEIRDLDPDIINDGIHIVFVEKETGDIGFFDMGEAFKDPILFGKARDKALKL